ncbi:MAG: response regulator [Cyanobacteria bacterium P01_F01_bin.13]
MSQTSVISELDYRIQRAKESLFTGVLSIGTDQDAEWFLYFLVGQIVWANTHIHSKRRWHRQFLKYSSDLRPQTLREIAHQAQNYKTVAQLVMHQKFSREQFSKIVRGCISEILFDIIHRATLIPQTSGPRLIYKVSSRNGANFPCIGLHREPIWEQVQQDWQDWQQANLVDYRPNLAPKIVQPDILQERTSPATFRVLRKIANGDQTLRDLAVKIKQPLVPFTQSMVPHIRRDLIKLVQVDDLTSRIPQASAQVSPQRGSQSSLKLSPSSPSLANHSLVNPSLVNEVSNSAVPNSLNHSKSRWVSPNGPVIVYIDDNPTDSQKMAEIFQGSGYRYVNIPDPLKALPKLLELKPQLIFLDLVMPVVNGYELCAQIRRISMFKDVPIIIMTNNNGIPDRVRAKVVGSTGFLGKPIKAKQVLKVAMKHLNPAPLEPPRQAYFSRLSPSV